MRRKLATTYAVVLTLLFVASVSLVFYFAWQEGTLAIGVSGLGVFFSVALAPIVHEIGHVVFAKSANMQCVYVKYFCFKLSKIEGKKRFSFASPFATDQTQTIPKSGGDMQNRAIKYTVGGLVFSGLFLVVLLIGALVCTLLGHTLYLLWGAVPYAAYLFFLNLPLLEYAGGKTDALVYRGIKKGADAEKCMLSAMEIQGELFEGKSFAEIEGKYYFDLPQLCEEEPLYVVLLDLRYRYYLDKGELDCAADCLNRLALAQEYLADEELEKVAAELVYMHSLNGDLESAEESGKLCQNFLKGETVTAKRILLAFSLASDKQEAVSALKEQAQIALDKEEILGVKKFEEKLIKKLFCE